MPIFTCASSDRSHLSRRVSRKLAIRLRVMTSLLYAVAAVMCLPMHMLVAQQIPEKPPSFSVVSIRPNEAADAGGATVSMPPGGGLTYNNVTLKGLVAFGYNVRAFQIVGGAAWIDKDRYDVVAKSESAANLDELRARVKTVLAERFGLVTHNDIREGSVYALRVSKTGSKLIPNKGDGLQARGRAGELFATKVTPDILASLLAARLDRPVLDRTGLTGEYDVKMEWDPAIERPTEAGKADSLAETRPSIFTAIEEQLGLRLSSEKGPIPMVVIDKVARPTPN